MKNILIIDDNISLCESIKISLKKYDYNIDTAYNGKSAISKIQESDYNTIITDVFMPDINGIKLAQDVFKKFPDMKIIIMTAKEFPQFQEPFKKLQKPFSNSELVKLIEN